MFQIKEMEFRSLFFLYIALYLYLLHIKTLAATTTSGGEERDRIALLAFKSKIKQDPQGVMKSWNSSLHFCNWQGVTCSRMHRRVTILDLNSKGLVGPLSPYIGNLSFLINMRLSDNYLQGNIPPEIGRLFRLEGLRLDNNSFEGEIPANISHCSKLVYFSVLGSKLVGKVPAEFATLSKLKYINFFGNYLTGGIPRFIENLTSLEGLSIGDNLLGGSIPDIFAQLKNLTFLGIAKNNLSGMIPLSIYNLTLLTVFSMSFNQLHGKIPQNFGLIFPHLEYLQLDVNNFTGCIPSSISNASKLEYIGMEANYFSGEVSVDFRGMQHLRVIAVAMNDLGYQKADDMRFLTSLLNCSNLKVVDLYANNFGGLPSYISGNFSTRIVYLDISSNHIFGRFPSWIANLVDLTDLEMTNNEFTGPVPDAIGKLKKLQRLLLYTNKFSGKIPSSLGNLSLLNELYLQDNRFQGTIPSSLEHCQNLILLNLSQNNLSDTIPKQLFNISTLSISLNLARNHLVGSLPPEVGNLKNLGELVVSENELSGEITNGLGGCISLRYLYMEGNFFRGSIPPSLRSLRGVERIDLSRNNLSGEIPDFLETFSLNYLNLSFNDFEGKVPKKGVFANTTTISIFGNKRLCGSIPKLGLANCPTTESKKRKPISSLAKILLIVISCILLGGVTLVSTFLYCWPKRRRTQHSLGSVSKVFLQKVSYQRLFKATDGFSSANLIGIGSFGSVYKGVIDEDEQIVAIKVLNLQRQGAFKSFMAECEALRNIRHRNLVKIITSCSTIDFQGNDFKALVYEFMPNRNLEMWLHPTQELVVTGQVRFQNLNLLGRLNIAIDVAWALDYLHHRSRQPIVHCDLKPSNILLDSDMAAHVGDFGLAKFLQEFLDPTQSSSIGIRGTIGYTAPEYGIGSEVSTNGDVYSFGIVLLEMMTGKRPTDHVVFEKGHNLHNFTKMALPDRIMEIVDPMLVIEESEVASNHIMNLPRQAARNNDNTTMESAMISIFKIGVACSMESPHDRMDITDAIRELHHVRDLLSKN